MTARYVDDPSLPPEERYRRLEQHHFEETTELGAKLQAARGALGSITVNLALRRASAENAYRESRAAIEAGVVPQRLLQLNPNLTIDDIKRYQPVEMKLLHDLSGIMCNVGYALDKAGLRAQRDEWVAAGEAHAYPKPEKKP